MKFNRLAQLGLASSLALNTTCDQPEKPGQETRDRITATVTSSATAAAPLATAVASTSSSAMLKAAKPEASSIPPKPLVVCHPKKVVLPGIHMVPRNEWAPLPANPEILGSMQNCNNFPIEKITLHHTGDGVITEPGEGRKRAGGSVYFHMGDPAKKRGKGWGDVAYHYLVTPSGEILEGRNPAFRGDSNAWYYPNIKNHSHTPEHHLIIALVGNFEKEEQKLTWQARQSVSRLIDANLTYYHLSPDDIEFHKNVAYTGCPGKKVIDWFNHGGRQALSAQPNLLSTAH